MVISDIWYYSITDKLRFKFVNKHVLQNHYTHSLYPLVGPLRLGVPDQ
jgi:hypothetical protein